MCTCMTNVTSSNFVLNNSHRKDTKATKLVPHKYYTVAKSYKNIII